MKQLTTEVHNLLRFFALDNYLAENRNINNA